MYQMYFNELVRPLMINASVLTSMTPKAYITLLVECSVADILQEHYMVS